LNTSLLGEESLSGRHPRTWQRGPGEGRRGGRNTDEWLFSDGIDGVGKELFKLCAKPER